VSAAANNSKRLGSGAVYFAVICEFFACSAVKPSAETAKFAKEDAKLRKGMAVPCTKLHHTSTKDGHEFRQS
jgi:hypothetical protein